MAKRKTEKEVKPTPIFYKNYINHAEVAAILIEKLNKLCIESKDLSHVTIAEPFDLNSLADKLYELFPEDMVNDLMESEFGQGILVGIWLDQTYGDDTQTVGEESDDEV